ncbi:DUF4320 family protein [Alkaliphilus pronyensis]|uniref:DUF4320 family protein n=1 Tax=Alkaliphilus pronyensis TaxID=1482732 RepID=A0A6I0EXR7_9FIRM|nr:DUF4320 family protein [Alkaliphilus pronyensis]KAB3534061.1 DUF4320 family protein [Alkaliphilus pronyensis]
MLIEKSQFKKLENKSLLNEKGLSTLGGLVIILCFLLFLPVLTSIANVYSTYRSLNNIASSTVALAKKQGGFNQEVLNLYEELLDDFNIDRGRLQAIYIPQKMMKVNKREGLGIEMNYNMEFRFMQMDKSYLEFDFVLSVRQNSYSQRYFRPHEL